MVNLMLSVEESFGLVTAAATHFATNPACSQASLSAEGLRQMHLVIVVATKSLGQNYDCSFLLLLNDFANPDSLQCLGSNQCSVSVALR